MDGRGLAAPPVFFLPKPKSQKNVRPPGPARPLYCIHATAANASGEFVFLECGRKVDGSVQVKKKTFLAVAIAALILLLCGQAASPVRSDGSFEAETRSVYVSENYWAVAKIAIKDGKIAALDFQITDRDKKEIFGPEYERHYAGMPEYVLQCRNEVKGIAAYAKAFAETKDLSRVDAISGATWSFNLFRDAVKLAWEKSESKRR